MGVLNQRVIDGRVLQGQISQRKAWEILQDLAQIPGKLRLRSVEHGQVVWKNVTKVEVHSILHTEKGRVRAWAEDGSYSDGLPLGVLAATTSYLDRPNGPEGLILPSGSALVVGATANTRVRSGNIVTEVIPPKIIYTNGVTHAS